MVYYILVSIFQLMVTGQFGVNGHFVQCLAEAVNIHEADRALILHQCMVVPNVKETKQKTNLVIHSIVQVSLSLMDYH